MSMLQSTSRTTANYLTTNWPIAWASRLDVALLCGLLLFTVELPIVWLGQSAEHQFWGVGEEKNWTGIIAAIRVSMWTVVTLIALGLVILWLTSVRRAYVCGLSPRMAKHPSYIDILLGTFIIVTPVVAFGFAVPVKPDGDLVAAGPLSDIGSLFRAFLNPALIPLSVLYSSMLATILTGTLRSSLKMVILSLLVCSVIAGLVPLAVSAAIRLLFPAIEESTVNNATAASWVLVLASFVAGLIWMSYGTTRIRARERLLSITFPSLFIFLLHMHGNIILIASLGFEWSAGLIMFSVLFVIISIVLAEVLSRQWARLSLMPK
jgi:hypothetical protein